MAVSLSSPVTGAAQTGLTSPTYTLSADTNPANEARQWVVTALGGTQTGVLPHSISSVFTLAYWRPRVYKTLQFVVTAVGQQVKSVPRNVHKSITRKGVLCASGVTSQMTITTEISLPAGAESYDSLSCKAALSAHIGGLTQQSAGWGETLVSGTL